MAIFSKFIRSVLRSRPQLTFRSNPSVYRPEKHYMRGSGPKSKKAGVIAGGQVPKAS